MRIELLKREDIHNIVHLAVGGTKDLEKEVTEQLDLAEMKGNVVYIRYGYRWLQRVEVVERLHLLPEVQKKIMNDKFWYETEIEL